jgi:hypothetical protein
MAPWTKEVVDLTIAGTSLTIDNVVMDGSNIGHVDDTDLLGLANGTLTVNGDLSTTGDMTLIGDLTITGGRITFGNSEIISNEEDNVLQFGVLVTEARFMSNGTDDQFISFKEGIIPRWAFGNDVTDDSFVIEAAANLGTDGGKLKIDTSGNVSIAGQFACNGQTPAAAPNWTYGNQSDARSILGDSTDTAGIANRLATLVKDLIAVGILS